jgi:hypothetical protein
VPKVELGFGLVTGWLRGGGGVRRWAGEAAVTPPQGQAVLERQGGDAVSLTGGKEEGSQAHPNAPPVARWGGLSYMPRRCQ